MARIVRVVSHDGTAHEVSMTAQQAAFCLRLAEVKSRTGQQTTFCDVVAKTQEQVKRN